MFVTLRLREDSSVSEHTLGDGCVRLGLVRRDDIAAISVRRERVLALQAACCGTGKIFKFRYAFMHFSTYFRN
jgi:hypothetical protein